MEDMKTRVSKEDFLKKAPEERDYLIYGAIEGHEERIMILETEIKKGPIAQSLPGIFGGFLGGFVAIAVAKAKTLLF